MAGFLLLQRNHTLFGSVWSSMRRKGQAPFGKRGLGGKLGGGGGNKANLKMNKRYGMGIGMGMGMGSNDGNTEADNDADFLYNSMRQVVSEGMNHITKTLMQTGGYDGERDDGSGFIGSDSAGDPVNTMTGELQTRGQENIPLRPLVISNNNNYSINVSQNVPHNE